MSHIGTLGILQQTNMNSPYNKQSITYTDQRI